MHLWGHELLAEAHQSSHPSSCDGRASQGAMDRQAEKGAEACISSWSTAAEGGHSLH